MKQTNVFGTYVPNYLLIKLLQTDFNIDNLKNLDVRDQRTFFHEYTHFLQNISGGNGLTYIWHTYDRIRQIVAYLQKEKNDEISIPLQNESVNYQKMLSGILQAISGSYKVANNLDDGTTYIHKANLYSHPDFLKLYEGKQLHFLNLVLADKNGKTADYHFGESAVSETMAYLIESKMFGKEKLNIFPYESCKKVGEYLNSTLTQNDEWLFALCDFSMLCSYPGMTFYTTVLDMRSNNFTPSNAEEIYEEGERLISKRGWNMWKDFEKNKDGAIHVLKELFNHEIFSETLEWFIYLLETGFRFRKENPFFMLNIYREEGPFEGYWNDVIATFGTPQIYNSEFKRFFNAPIPLKNKEKEIEPLFLISLQEISKTLFDAKYTCDLYECCNSAKIGPETNYNCKSAPWEWAKEDKTCAYGAQWQLLGLNEKTVTFKE